MSAASKFILRAVQDWGQSEAERIGAVQAVLDEAGINARATCWPIFGGIWKEPCTGPEAERATEWLKSLTDEMPRGKFENETAHVQAAIDQAGMPS